MCEENKKKEVNIFLNNIYRFVEKEIAKGKYEKAMAAISIAGEIQYQFNQEYVDTDLEKNISLIAKRCGINVFKRAEEEWISCYLCYR